LNSKTKYFAVPDSGYFMIPPDVAKYAKLFEVTADTSFVSRSEIMPKGCPYLNDNNNIHKCFYP
jgi:hypothetical protein